ncbi:MAG: hypothetical protein LBR70_02990 [Lactobacillaceae bacterium]|jgi:hypothetical protein|nr:hypothetical protein [Lactobacillaceae bacterium]
MKKNKMQIQNEYIGDDKFKKMLEHYLCPTPLEVIKMKFIGAMCSPNMAIRPADVISSFWEQGKEPRLETKEEADLFFKFFMGLWDELFEKVKANKVELSKFKTKDKNQLMALCNARFEEVELGYVEGFWGGKEDLNIPAYLAEMVDSLTELAGVYKLFAKKLEGLDKAPNDVLEKLIYTDKMVVKAINFIIENHLLPRINDVARTLN